MTKRRPTLRDLMIGIAAVGLDLAWLAGIARGRDHLGPWDMLALLFWPLLLLAAIVLYVPPRIDEFLAVVLIVIVLALLLVPALQHS